MKGRAVPPHTPRPYVDWYLDRNGWQASFQAFIENERQIDQTHLAVPGRLPHPPILGLQPEPAFVDLIRLHQQEPQPYEGGDVVVDSRIGTDAFERRALVALKYRWWSPATYTLTLVLDLPRSWAILQSALQYGGFLVGAAPLDLSSAGVFLALPDDLDKHLAVAAAMLWPEKAGRL